MVTRIFFITVCTFLKYQYSVIPFYHVGEKKSRENAKFIKFVLAAATDTCYNKDKNNETNRLCVCPAVNKPDAPSHNGYGGDGMKPRTRRGEFCIGLAIGAATAILVTAGLYVFCRLYY